MALEVYAALRRTVSGFFLRRCDKVSVREDLVRPARGFLHVLGPQVAGRGKLKGKDGLQHVRGDGGGAERGKGGGQEGRQHRHRQPQDGGRRALELLRAVGLPRRQGGRRLPGLHHQGTSLRV